MWLLLLGGCLVEAIVLGVDDTGQDDDTDACLADPIIDHTPVSGPVSASEDLILDLTAYDYDGLVSVEVRYRPENTTGWRTLGAEPVGEHRYQAVISQSYLEVGEMQYFLRAYDSCGDKGCAPVQCQGNPWTFEVVVP